MRKTEGPLSIRSFLVAAAILFVCALVLVCFVNRARDDSRTMACGSNLFGIGDVLRNYHAEHGTYPPSSDEVVADAAPVSWRVITQKLRPGPEMDGYDLGKAWNSSHNEPFINARMGKHFSCQSDPSAGREGRTSYLAVVGKGTVWSDVRAGRIKNPETETPNKIIVMEVPHSDIYWTEPRDISVAEAMALFEEDKLNHHGRHRGGLHYLTADGRVHEFNEISSIEEFATRLRAAD